jgi:hypothetical protein
VVGAGTIVPDPPGTFGPARSFESQAE